MLTIGTDSYVTVEEASSYTASNYLSTSAQKAAWTAASDPDKEVLLRVACQQIDQLNLLGAKWVSGQKLAFPRYSPYLTETAGVPACVKYAQIEQALSLLVDTQAHSRQEMQAQGVQSFSVGNFSETFAGGNTNALISVKANKLLGGWINGTFRIS